MAETYLNLGNTQIDQQNFLTTAANNVQAYVAEQPWSKKKKERFLTAYQDIMQKGISGASNNTGVWAIDTNENIDLSSMSKKDQEMYSEAAYFILNQMNSIAPQSTEEEVAKEDLPVFDATLSTQEINRFLENNLLGGQQLRIGGERDNWNYLDERGDNGLRGIANRANKLANVLEGYANSLQEGKYNFEGTAYQDLNDLKSKLLTASQKLRSGVMDQSTKDALNQIGLDWRDYFNDGSGDIAGTDASGNPVTYADLAAAKQQETEALEKQATADAAIQAEKERKANLGVLEVMPGAKAVDAINNPQGYQDYLAKTYGVGDTGYNAINTRIQSLLSRGTSLNADEKRQLGNFIHYIRTYNPNYQKSNITDQEWQELGTHSKILKSTNKDDFIRLPWQTQEGRYIYADKSGNIYFLKPANKQKYANPKFVRSQEYNDYRKNFLLNTKAGNLAAQKAYLNQEGAENAEIGAIIADIASIVDPEPFSAMGLSLGAAGARNYAKLQQPGKWSLGDYTSQGIDYLTSVIGAVPLAGDAVLAGKVIKNLRRLGRFGAWSDVVQSTPGLADIWNNKIMGDQKMTKQDWRTLGTALRGLVSHGRLNQSNLAARTVMQQRGLETGNAWHQRAGFTSSAPKKTSTPTLKVTKNGKSEEIDITAKQEQDLKEAFKKVKPSERTAKAREILGNDKIPEGTEVKVSDGIHSTARNWNRFTRRTSDSFGTKSTPVTRTTTRSDEEFENFLKNRSTWNKIGLGTNRYLRRIDRQLNLNNNSATNPTRTSEEQASAEQNLATEYRASQVGRTNPGVKNPSELPENIKFNRETIKNYKDIIKGNFSNNELKSGSYNLTGTPLQVVKQPDGTFNVIFKGNVVANERNQREVQKTIRDIIKNTVKQGKTDNNSKISAKEMGNLLKEFKAKGWLKQGGTIDKQRIQRYKEYINK